MHVCLRSESFGEVTWTPLRYFNVIFCPFWSLTALGHIMFWLCALLFFRGQGWVWVNDDKAVTHLLSGPVVFSIPDHHIQTQECDESLQMRERDKDSINSTSTSFVFTQKHFLKRLFWGNLLPQMPKKAQVFAERVETKQSHWCYEKLKVKTKSAETHQTHEPQNHIENLRLGKQVLSEFNAR